MNYMGIDFKIFCGQLSWAQTVPQKTFYKCTMKMY